jgi:hypothetical protein
MADPASVVGFVSLSFQVIQGLKLYYTQYLSFHDDIDALLMRVDGIQALLSSLECQMETFNYSDDAMCTQLDDCLRVCNDSIEKLKDYQQKCSEPRHSPGKLRSKLEWVKLRVLYPFKKETLEDLHKALDRLLANLQIALQISQR